MIINILNSKNFIVGLDDAIAEVSARGFNTTQDNISVFISMNGNTLPELDEFGNQTGFTESCVNVKLFVNETPYITGMDIAQTI